MSSDPSPDKTVLVAYKAEPLISPWQFHKNAAMIGGLLFAALATGRG